MPDRLRIEIDETLADIVPGFLERKRGDFSTILADVGASDFAEIARLAHRIKGEGGSYGFDELTVMAREIEECAKGGDRAAIVDLVARASAYLDCLDVVYRPFDD
jgi:HPt (histidine-containing phosphotransfer) domain-containing protein